MTLDKVGEDKLVKKNLNKVVCRAPGQAPWHSKEYEYKKTLKKRHSPSRDAPLKRPSVRPPVEGPPQKWLALDKSFEGDKLVNMRQKEILVLNIVTMRQKKNLASDDSKN